MTPIEGEKNDFFSMITDIRLDATNLDILIHPPEQGNGLMRDVLQGTNTYATVCLRPMLMFLLIGRVVSRSYFLINA